MVIKSTLRNPALFADIKQIKKCVDISVLCVGGIRSSEMADRLIAVGKTDMVVMSRTLLADPEMPNNHHNVSYGSII
jgi:2,4-dienoyl-CoA reductase-like NADH-dependent reductase (Old Yellow Enzyme family)